MSGLTPEEIAELRKLVPLAHQIEEEVKYRASVRLVYATWRQFIIGLAAAITAIILLRDQIAVALGVK